MKHIVEVWRTRNGVFTLTEYTDKRTVGFCHYVMGPDGKFYLTEITDLAGKQIYVLDEETELASEIAEHPENIEAKKGT